MGRQHGRSVVVGERRERRVFSSADGRILGTEYLIEEWFTPFEKSGETTETKTVVATEGPFYSMAEAGRWVDELRAQQAVERVKANGGTKIVFVN